jgi:signal transduction histidine kinase
VRVAEVVSNLIANALVHGSAEAPILVRVRRAEENVVLEVRNRGPIIDREVLPSLFEPFRRGPGAAPSFGGRTAGLGLGLHIVKQIAEAHGGTISARSSAEEGTVFILRLPAAEGGAGLSGSGPGVSQNGG